MKVKCPKCKKMLNVPVKYQGQEIKCPNCNERFIAKAEKNCQEEKVKKKKVSKNKQVTFWQDVKNHFIFNTMIIPQLIKIFYGFYMAMAFIIFIDSFFGGRIFDVKFKPFNISAFILGLFFIRLTFELLIIFFKIHEDIREVLKELKSMKT